MPEYNHYKMNYDNTNYNLVKNIVKRLNIPFIDIHEEVFEKEHNPLKFFPFEDFGHYNVGGIKKLVKQFTISPKIKSLKNIFIS